MYIDLYILHIHIYNHNIIAEGGNGEWYTSVYFPLSGDVHPRVESASRVQLGIPRVELGTFLERSYHSGHVPITHR